MAFLCQHSLKVYKERVKEVLESYSDPLDSISYSDLSNFIILRKTLTCTEDEEIRSLSPNRQMPTLRFIISQRMWGFENLMGVLFDSSVDSCLTQQLLRSYKAHVVDPIKKIQTQNSCGCFLSKHPNFLWKFFYSIVSKTDSLLYEVGTSIPLASLDVFPVRNYLDFLNRCLPTPQTKILSEFVRNSTICYELPKDKAESFRTSLPSIPKAIIREKGENNAKVKQRPRSLIVNNSQDSQHLFNFHTQEINKDINTKNEQIEELNILEKEGNQNLNQNEKNFNISRIPSPSTLKENYCNKTNKEINDRISCLYKNKSIGEFKNITKKPNATQESQTLRRSSIPIYKKLTIIRNNTRLNDKLNNEVKDQIENGREMSNEEKITNEESKVNEEMEKLQIEGKKEEKKVKKSENIEMKKEGKRNIKKAQIPQKIQRNPKVKMEVKEMEKTFDRFQTPVSYDFQQWKNQWIDKNKNPNHQ